MFAVTVFVFVIIVGSMAVFSTTSSEAMLVGYEHESTEAFYLADGAIERARARIAGDPSWRDGWANVPLGGGTYSLTITDTINDGEPAIRLVATGTSGRASRAIEALAEIPTTGTPLALFSNSTLYGYGAIHVYDRAHANSRALFGNDNRYLASGTATVEPHTPVPALRVDPEDFENTTYYYVRCTRGSGPPRAAIYDGDNVDITAAKGDDLRTVVRYMPWTRSFSLSFNNRVQIQRYFDDQTGVFNRAPGDSAVVVNFGEPPLISNPGLNGTTFLTLSGNGNSNTDISATVINVRFTGLNDSQRSDPRYWSGGTTTLSRVDMVPRNGIAAILSTHISMGRGTIRIGSAENPGVLYTTSSSLILFSGIEVTGSLVTLNYWYGFGSPLWGGAQNYTFAPGFLDKAPVWLKDNWPGIGATALEIVSWREVPVAGA